MLIFKEIPMSAYRTVFPQRHVLLPVVHAETPKQALENTKIAHDEGAHGVFLINMTIAPWSLVHCYETVRAAYPDWWIGLNFLGVDAHAALTHAAELWASGVWIDNAGYQEYALDPSRAVRELRDWQQNLNTGDLLVFGGVAFKYQAAVENVGEAARTCAPYLDVPTTSGKGTGSAPDVDKIRTMKQAIGEHPLAIASGISAANVDHFKPYADCFLVATEISKTETELDPTKVRELARTLTD
jgi:predicted TIM-barrel enzyme